MAYSDTPHATGDEVDSVTAALSRYDRHAIVFLDALSDETSVPAARLQTVVTDIITAEAAIGRTDHLRPIIHGAAWSRSTQEYGGATVVALGSGTAYSSGLTYSYVPVLRRLLLARGNHDQNSKGRRARFPKEVTTRSIQESTGMTPDQVSGAVSTLRVTNHLGAKRRLVSPSRGTYFWDGEVILARPDSANSQERLFPVEAEETDPDPLVQLGLRVVAELPGDAYALWSDSRSRMYRLAPLDR